WLSYLHGRATDRRRKCRARPRKEKTDCPGGEKHAMYIPAAFAEADLGKLHDFIERNSFGLLVSQVDGLPFATHLPFLLERRTGPHGSLVCHVARGNPQWRQAGGQTALAIFSGPHAY